jgi:hypothetical protein
VSVPSAGIFRSLEILDYRTWAAGAFVSNVGTWVQRTAQNWLVLTELTHHNASAAEQYIEQPEQLSTEPSKLATGYDRRGRSPSASSPFAAP